MANKKATSGGSSKTKSPRASKKSSEIASKASKASPSSKVSKTKSAAKKGKEQSESTNGGLVPNKVVNKAVEELKKYLERSSESNDDEKLDLLASDEDGKDLFLQITSKSFFSSKPNFKPKIIRLRNSIYGDKLEEFKTCLIVRDELITSNDKVEEFEQAGLSTLNQIVPVSSLKTEFKNFEKRREFYSQYDLFLFDDALMNLMPTLLGNVFYGRHSSKIPVPIRVTPSSSKDISISTVKNQLEKCLSSTYYLPPTGVNVSLRIGSLAGSLSDEQISENLHDAVQAFDPSIIRTISLKTESSPSLPLFYTDELYNDANVLTEDTSKKSEKSEDKSPLSTFEKGLLELADHDEASKLIGKKLRQKKAKSKKLSKKKKHDD
ncbi:Piso0_001740 [Millerozyma farinosa CBS 7064]|uniref:Piso0_001740 protein n=1 Tax=Pichia sorbitophila (strain ATCC MYA-4447 / BCRC 22081 / CBS 7064 / NBRC 10061 / NRRL Y-12695) TaxID=559304 RepID=G8YLL2_PICSO|nr:Piso0_001740 [Millerozyma farinosa CBS 7064]